MHALALDIETIPDPDLDADAHAAVLDLLAHRAERGGGPVPDLDTYMALCPSTARPVCATFVDPSDASVSVYFDRDLLSSDADAVRAAILAADESPSGIDVDACEGERALLAAVAAQAAEGRPLVTFNGRGFDLLVLWHRSLKHGLATKSPWFPLLNENRYRPERHVDLLDTLTHFSAGQRYPLAMYGIGLLGENPKSEMTGADVLPAVRAGQGEKLLVYNYRDTAVTARLYHLLFHRPTATRTAQRATLF